MRNEQEDLLIDLIDGDEDLKEWFVPVSRVSREGFDIIIVPTPPMSLPTAFHSVI